jgi:predicted PurR-regulated permease PerM
MSRLRRLGETCLWLLVIGVAVAAALQLAARLRLVVLPVMLAIILATFLAPPAAWLRARGFRDGLAAITVVVAALLVVTGALALLAPRIVAEFSRLDVELTNTVDRIQTWIRERLPLSGAQIDDSIARIEQQLRTSVDALAGPLVRGAITLLEIATGCVLALVVLFFLLKDGRRIWEWMVSLAPARHRTDVDEIGRRGWRSLGGFVRGQTLVALFDAVLIGAALFVMGIPLALPLAMLTFAGAYVPVIGATVTGLLAVMLAIVSQGFVAAAALLAIILVVQQLEGNVFQPVVVGRAIDVHPLAILLGITAGGVLAGIVGAMIAAPIVAVCGAVLGYLREQDSR